MTQSQTNPEVEWLATSIPVTVSSAHVVMNEADAGDKTHTCHATDGRIHRTAWRAHQSELLERRTAIVHTNLLRDLTVL